MRPEIGIPAGMLTGLGAQAVVLSPGLPALWWIGAIMLILMAITVMAYLVAVSLKKAKEEWILVVWSRPEKIKVLLGFFTQETNSYVPANSILVYCKDKDQYEFIYRMEDPIVVSPREIMDNPETFDLP